MRYLTDRKRAIGTGSGRTGTDHHWMMLVSSVLMVFAVPTLVLVIAGAMGGSQASVTAYFAQPFVALVTGLSLTVVIHHVMQETLEAVEDYVHGAAGKLTLVAVKALGYVLIAAGIFAIARMAL